MWADIFCTTYSLTCSMSSIVIVLLPPQLCLMYTDKRSPFSSSSSTLKKIRKSNFVWNHELFHTMYVSFHMQDMNYFFCVGLILWVSFFGNLLSSYRWQSIIFFSTNFCFLILYIFIRFLIYEYVLKKIVKEKSRKSLYEHVFLL